MGIGGIGIGPLIVILVIVILLFGTKKLKSLGSDLGGAVKGFKKAVNTDEEQTAEDSKEDQKESIAADAKNTDEAATVEKTQAEEKS